MWPSIKITKSAPYHSPMVVILPNQIAHNGVYHRVGLDILSRYTLDNVSTFHWAFQIEKSVAYLLRLYPRSIDARDPQAGTKAYDVYWARHYGYWPSLHWLHA